MTPSTFQPLQEQEEDIELIKIATERQAEPDFVEVSLDDL